MAIQEFSGAGSIRCGWDDGNASTIVSVDRLTPLQKDRAAGVLVGAAAGDALGAGYEFRLPCPPEDVTMLRGALTGRPAGSWTDDTDMALGIARVPADGHRLDEVGTQALVAERFLSWYADRPPDMGSQTRAVLSATTQPTMLAEAALAYQHAHPDAAGNGSLMRTGPVALAHLGDDEAIASAARAISALTHPHPLAGDACVLWSIAIDRAVREGRLDGIWDGLALLASERRQFWEEMITTAETLPIGKLRPNGYVLTALQAAHRAITSTAAAEGAGHLEAGLRQAVAIGDDTDTVAAIAGALLGARYGASAVPFAWRRRLAGWPRGVGHRDLVAMGVLAASQGQPDSAGWPLADDLTGYYRENFAASGICVELPGRPGVLWGDIAALGTADAEAFVSLCRIGSKQRRGEHHEVWLMDGPDNADLPFVLAATADAVETLRQDHGSVFVHCVRWESRTPAVAVAWLVRHHGLNVNAALDEVRGALPGCQPNSVMLSALKSVTQRRGTPIVPRMPRRSR